jgi:hypothetical protein
MQAIESRPYISRPRIRDVSTGVDTESPVTRGLIQEMKLELERKVRAKWQAVIKQTLLCWLRDPRQLEGDGVDAPSGAILRLSLDLAESCMEDNLAPPNRIVPDPNGGIVFERRDGDTSEVLHVWDDGSIEFMKFEGTKLVDRGPFPVGN